MMPSLSRLKDLFFILFFSLAAIVQQNDPDSIFWEIVYIIPAMLCLADLCSQKFKECHLRITFKNISVGLYGFLAMYLLWTILTRHPLKSIVKILELEDGREFMGVCIILAWLISGKSSGSRIWKKKLLTLMFAIIPLTLWGCCYIDGVPEHLSYCHHIVRGCTTATKKQI